MAITDIIFKIKRGNAAGLSSLASNNLLTAGELYLITDQNRLAVGLSTNTYEVFAKSSEVGSGGSGIKFTESETAPTSPALGDIWLVPSTATWYQRVTNASSGQVWAEINAGGGGGGSSGSSSAPSGTTFPTTPNNGDFFYRTSTDRTLEGLFIYQTRTTSWARIGTDTNLVVPRGPTLPLTGSDGELFFLSGTASSADIVVKQVGFAVRPGSSSTTGFNQPITAGSTLLLITANYQGTVSSVTSTLSGSFTRLIEVLSNDDNRLTVWGLYNALPGSDTITLGSGGSFISGNCIEVAGISALDKFNITLGSLTATNTLPNAVAKSFVLTGSVNNSGGQDTFVTPAGYTLFDRDNNSDTSTGHQTAYKITSSIETSTATTTGNVQAANTYDTFVASFSSTQGASSDGSIYIYSASTGLWKPIPKTGNGTATLNFGNHPGSNEASVTIIGQNNITINNTPKIAFSYTSLGNKTANDHKFASMFVNLMTGPITPGTGFTIYATSEHKMTGSYTINYSWN